MSDGAAMKFALVACQPVSPSQAVERLATDADRLHEFHSQDSVRDSTSQKKSARVTVKKTRRVLVLAIIPLLVGQSA